VPYAYHLSYGYHFSHIDITCAPLSKFQVDWHTEITCVPLADGNDLCCIVSGAIAMPIDLELRVMRQVQKTSRGAKWKRHRGVPSEKDIEGCQVKKTSRGAK